jgi:hypothetical protein
VAAGHDGTAGPLLRFPAGHRQAHYPSQEQVDHDDGASVTAAGRGDDGRQEIDDDDDDDEGDAHEAEDPKPIEHEIDQLVFGELKASMRAITSSAFAIDAFYASVKERSPQHPDADKWRRRRTAREKQVTETFRYHLRIRKHAVEEIKRRVSEIFRFRDWAVHPGAKFQQPEYRDDINLLVDWHFVAFRRANAIGATALTSDCSTAWWRRSTGEAMNSRL